jgi:hypothetical protein
MRYFEHGVNILGMVLSMSAVARCMAGSTRILRLAVVFVSFAICCECQETGSLKITVTDTSGASIRGARVRVVNRQEISVVTDQNGNAFLEGLPPGEYEVSADSESFTRKSVSGIAVASGVKRDVVLKLEQAPPNFSNIRTDKPLDPDSYDKLLAAFHEPDLCQGRIDEHAQSYVFLWQPTFDHPVFIRIDIEHDGTGTLHTKILSGAGGYKWGTVKASTTRKLSTEEEFTLFTTLADIGFWTLPARVDVDDPYHIVLDGTLGVVEGVRNGECHVVERYSSPLTEVFSRYFLGEVGKVHPYYQHE